MNPSLRPGWKSLFLACAVALSLPGSAHAQNKAGGSEDYFGSINSSNGGALIGILYDLKQTQKREKSSETDASYLQVVARFLDANWDESILNQYYRVTRPLYTTRITIPSMNANAAPAAFGAADTVQPRMWLVHYKGQISPPEDGTYRFVGKADNVLAVAINSKTVLVSYIRTSEVPCAWNKANTNGKSKALLPGSDEAFNGDWMELKKGDPVDIDIILGERPGGAFWAWLFMEKKNENYGQDARGKTLLPIFHLDDKAPPPPFPVSKPWTGYQ